MKKFLDELGLAHFYQKIKQKIDNIYWIGTQAEYDNLKVKDDNKLYFIVEEKVQGLGIEIVDKTISVMPKENGNYTMYYADNSKKALSNYEAITTIDFKGNKIIYSDFNTANIAPNEAEYIVLINNSDQSVSGYSTIPSSWKKNLGSKLYSFGLLSDTHIDGDGDDISKSEQDFTNELTYFKNNNVNFVAITGDLTYDGRVEDYQAFRRIKDSVAPNLELIACTGNHDVLTPFSNWETYIDKRGRNYEWKFQNDIYLILGLKTDNLAGDFISIADLNWLIEKLNLYKNQRVFVLFHVFIDSVGNVNDLYPYVKMSGTNATHLRNIMKHFKNVILMTGHSHLDYRLQKYGKNANISINRDGCQRIHTPSGSKPRKNDTGENSSGTYNYWNGCEGAIVEVYNNGLIIKGRDFEIEKNLPIASYYMETSLISVTEYPLIEQKVGQEIGMIAGNIDYRNDGALTETGTSPTYIRTNEYIPVKGGHSYSYSYSNTSTTAVNILTVFYDSNKTFIKGWNKDSTNVYNYKYLVNGETLECPSKAAYAMCRIKIADTNTKIVVTPV